jgi:hypothetical protein
MGVNLPTHQSRRAGLAGDEELRPPLVAVEQFGQWPAVNDLPLWVEADLPTGGWAAVSVGGEPLPVHTVGDHGRSGDAVGGGEVGGGEFANGDDTIGGDT